MWPNPWRSLTPCYVLGAAIVAALVGCVSSAPSTATLEPSLTDRSILTDTPCAAPCWYGLELGKSTKADALKTVQILSFIDSQSFPERPDHYLYIAGSEEKYVDAIAATLQCRQPKADGCAELVFVNDSLKEIHLFPNYYLNFSQIVEHLDDPDYVQFFPLHTEGKLCSVALIWKQRGIIATFYSAGAKYQVVCNKTLNDHRVDRNLPVQLIRYMLPENSALASVPEPGVPWVGFVEP